MHKLLWVLAACASIALCGCGNTLKGAQQDAAHDQQQVGAAAHNAATATKDAAANAGAAIENSAAATELTPKVKVAIVRDPVLNNPKNLVNVSTHDDAVHLTGHVMTDSMKQRATDDAQLMLTGKWAKFTVSNDLTVAGS